MGNMRCIKFYHIVNNVNINIFSCYAIALLLPSHFAISVE